VNEKNIDDIGFILDFIKTKDISILQNRFRWVYDVVFDKTLLNRSKTNFNETILKAYQPKQPSSPWFPANIRYP
jgi:hypothetical protein